MLACLVAASAGAQTIKSLGYNTTNGQVVYSGTNDLSFPATIRIGTNQSGLGSGGSLFYLLSSDGGVSVQIGTNRITVYDEIAFGGVSGTALSNAATTRTNFGLGGTNTVTFSNLQLNSFSSGGSGGFVGRNNTQLALYGTNVSSSVPAFYGWDGFNNAAMSAGTSRTNLGLGAIWLTNNNVTNFRTDIGLGATNNVTFSNLTLSGVDNTASNQVASSAGSLITRDLIYQSQMDFNSGDMIAPIAAQQTGTGASASGFATTGYGVQITTNTNTSAGAYSGDMLWSQSSYSGSPMPANKAIDYTLKGVMLRVETNANFVNRIVFGVGAPARTIPAAGTPAATNQSWGVNFFYDGTNQVAQPFWYTTNYNTAANIILTNLSDLSWTARVYTMRFQQTTNGQISFYINNGLAVRLSSTATWTTNVTWPSVNYAGRFIGMECASATNAAPTVGSRMHYRNAYIKYDP